MAGGKETPRQKMIGMMYLVLTALLALNVSKSILDAFVSIEENTQKGNIAMVERGDGYFIAVRSELGALEATNEEGSKEKIKSIKYALEQMELINDETGKIIKEIDDLKIKILKESGEDISKVKENDELSILWSKYDKEKNPCLPTRMHLMAVAAKDQYDVPMHVIIGEDIKKPSGEGMKLWKSLLAYRAKLMQLAGTYEWGGKQFEVKTSDVNQYKTNKELTEKVKAMTYAEGVNPDDSEGLQNIYTRLTKLEKNEVHDVKDVHWIGMTFDHSPLVAAIASLSSLQQDILSARSEALYLWKQKISTGEYSFDKIMPLAYGPSFARSGEDVEIQVMMAAFDSQNPPKVEVEGLEDANISVENGVATVKLRAGGASMDYKGKVAIQNKQGAWKSKDWEISVPVLTPSGAIELTELNVLYRKYANKVEASGSGYETYSLSGSNASISPKGNNQYTVTPGGGKSASLTITGKNADGTSSVLKKATYRVSNLPDPVLYWGAAKSGKKGSRSSRILQAKYPPEIPLAATFKVTKWTCYAPGLKGAPPTGAGGNISNAGALINAVPPGTGLSFNCTVVGPDGIARQIGGSWSL